MAEIRVAVRFREGPAWEAAHHAKGRPVPAPGARTAMKRKIRCVAPEDAEFLDAFFALPANVYAAARELNIPQGEVYLREKEIRESVEEVAVLFVEEPDAPPETWVREDRAKSLYGLPVQAFCPRKTAGTAREDDA